MSRGGHGVKSRVALGPAELSSFSVLASQANRAPFQAAHSHLTDFEQVI
jgi:hypothetical protein